MQLSLFQNPLRGWPDPKDGIERIILDDACGIYTEKCLICGSELETVREVNHKACDTCWSRRLNK